MTLGVTGSGGTNLLTCTGSTLTGDAPLGSTVSAVYSVKGTLIFSPCTLAGNASYWHCGFTWTGTAQPSAAVTLGNADLTCVMRLVTGSTPLCHLGGTTPVHYINPSGATAGRFTWTGSSTLVISHASGTTCSAFIGSFTSAVAHLAHRTDSLTGSGPIITRTA